MHSSNTQTNPKTPHPKNTPPHSRPSLSGFAGCSPSCLLQDFCPSWNQQRGEMRGRDSLGCQSLRGHTHGQGTHNPSVFSRSVLKPSTLPDIPVTDGDTAPSTENPGNGAGEPGSDPPGSVLVLGSSCLMLWFYLGKHKRGFVFNSRLTFPSCSSSAAPKAPCIILFNIFPDCPKFDDLKGLFQPQ